jgi:hypothetical protein
MADETGAGQKNARHFQIRMLQRWPGLKLTGAHGGETISRFAIINWNTCRCAGWRTPPRADHYFPYCMSSPMGSGILLKDTGEPTCTG